MRRTMEDKTLVVQDVAVPELRGCPHLSPQSWLGVYDGHGGDDASAFLQKRLHTEVSLSLARCAGELKAASPGPALDALVEAALREAFLAADADFLEGQAQAGSTATTVLVLGGRAYCANVGDSRTVLGLADGSSMALSSDHKPSRADESARIKAAGGFIINKRVMGELAVSRVSLRGSARVNAFCFCFCICDVRGANDSPCA